MATEPVPTWKVVSGCCDNVFVKLRRSMAARAVRDCTAAAAAAQPAEAQLNEAPSTGAAARLEPVLLGRSSEALASRVRRPRPWTITSSTLSFPPAYRWTKCSRSRTATTTAARPSVSVPEASACACECCVCANRHNENEDKACLEKAQRVDCNLRRKVYVN